MKVKADYSLCESNGFCERIAPEVFHLDENDDLWIANDGEVSPEARRQGPRGGQDLSEDGPLARGVGSRTRGFP